MIVRVERLKTREGSPRREMESKVGCAIVPVVVVVVVVVVAVAVAVAVLCQRSEAELMGGERTIHAQQRIAREENT